MNVLCSSKELLILFQMVTLVKLNSTGNPGMTVGGTGDLLAGLVGGLMAQGHSAFEAAYLGSYINGAAGDLAMDDYAYNFVASDILKYIPRYFQGLMIRIFQVNLK